MDQTIFITVLLELPFLQCRTIHCNQCNCCWRRTCEEISRLCVMGLKTADTSWNVAENQLESANKRCIFEILSLSQSKTLDLETLKQSPLRNGDSRCNTFFRSCVPLPFGYRQLGHSPVLENTRKGLREKREIFS